MFTILLSHVIDNTVDLGMPVFPSIIFDNISKGLCLFILGRMCKINDENKRE